jgi:hypothetical protein
MAEGKLTFAAIVLVAIVAIVGMMGLMGFGGITGAVIGTMNVTLSGTADIILTDSSTSFGTGYVNASFASATINSEGTKTNWVNTTTFPSTDPMSLQNNGSRAANVTIKSDKDAAGFIGGTGPTQSFKGSNNEAGSCTGTLASVYGTLGMSELNLCSKLEYLDMNDTIDINYQLVIPSNAPQAAKGEVITCTAYAG